MTRYIFIKSMDVTDKRTIKWIMEDIEEMTGLSKYIKINIEPTTVRSNLNYELVADVLEGDYNI